jgi:hypothetical protein
MSKNKFVVSNSDVEHFLKNLLIDHELFTAAEDIEIWKSAFIDLYGIEEVIVHELNTWKKSENFAEIGGKSLDALHKVTNSFIKKVRKQGTAGEGSWCGSSPECTNLLKEYINESLPFIKDLVSKVQPSSEVKQEIDSILSLYSTQPI